jgi:hypothetical protein
MPSYDRALWALRTWLDSWAGIGHVAVGMHRQGYDLQLTQYDGRGWRATFYTTGLEHSPTGAIGTSWERTPWLATQRATSQRRSGRPDYSLRALAQLLRNGQRAESTRDEPLDLEDGLLLGRADLGLDDRDGEVFLLPAD